MRGYLALAEPAKPAEAAEVPVAETTRAGVAERCGIGIVEPCRGERG